MIVAVHTVIRKGSYMPQAYVVAETWVRNEQVLDTYKRLAAPSVLKFGGELLATGGQMDLLSGENSPDRFTIVRFSSREIARQWWESEEYREARKLRAEIGPSQVVIVEGK
jgi:uncharacterized protein (DUF1330 family)